MAKEIIWTESAVKDRLNIYLFWLDHNKSEVYSNKLEVLFNESAKLISQFSEIGIKTDVQSIRVKVVRNYKVFYRDTSNKIEILRVWDTQQKPGSINF